MHEEEGRGARIMLNRFLPLEIHSFIHETNKPSAYRGRLRG